MIILLHSQHPDDRFNDYIVRACHYYGEQLISKQLLRHVVVTIKFNKHLDVYATTEIEGRNSKGKPRELMIEIHPYASGTTILKTLAHEFVHVKQYVYEELDEEMTKWMGRDYDSDAVDYYKQPWEIDAYGRETGLFTEFAKREKLWNVFKDARNPDTQLEHEPIGWINEDEQCKTERTDTTTEGTRPNNREVSYTDTGRCSEHEHGSQRPGCTTKHGSKESLSIWDRVQKLIGHRYL